MPDSLPVTIGYWRAGEALEITFEKNIDVWQVVDYLAANFQKPNAAADARLDAVLAAREPAAISKKMREHNARKR